MAYANTINSYENNKYVIYEISETDAAVASEATLNTRTQVLELERFICTLDSGTGTTVDPILEGVDSDANRRVMVENAAPAASVDNYVDSGLGMFSVTGVFYHRSTVDAGTDNVVRTIYFFRKI